MTLEQDQARARARARARIKANAQPADDGVNPVPVAEDQPGWDWLRENAPGVFQTGQEFSRGMSEGIGSIPNMVPNIANSLNELYHLHTDPANTPPPEPLMNPWFDLKSHEPGPAPGFEGVRRSGQVTGASVIGGPSVAVTAPFLSAGGRFAGDVVDTLIDPNDQHKWGRTLETVAPVMSRAVAPAMSRVSPTVAGGVSLLQGGGLLDSLATYLATKGLNATGKGVSRTMSWPQTLDAATAPLIADEPRRYGGPR